MNEQTPPLRSNADAFAAEQTPPATRFFDQKSMIIIGIFAVAAVIAIWTMASGYRHNRNTGLADRYFNNKEYAKAIPYLKAIVNKYPDAWMRIKMLGDACLLQDEPDARQAQTYYQKVLENPGYQQAFSQAIDPATKDDLDLNEEMGICYSLLGEEKKAQEYFTKVLAQEPDSSAANYFQGVQYFKAGSYRQAARCFQNAATGDRPGFAVAAGGEESAETPKPSKWGDYWSRQAAPYRKEIARKILETPLASPPAEQTTHSGKG